jgi:coniferyl-aldehyde dehydrogenase
MAPWNYPLSLALMPLATALAAGNRAMIKPSEFTPATSQLLADLLGAIFPPEMVSVVQGDASMGAAFSALPLDHLLFTGSTTVGRAVMKAASEHLVPVTLELGGKSPAIVGRSCDLERAAMSIAYGKLANAGQTCIAPDYAMVPRERIVAFVAAFRKAVEALYPDGPTSPDYTSIVNDRHYQRLAALIEDARAGGARILEVGAKPGDAARRPHSMAPTLVLDTTDAMTIMQRRYSAHCCPSSPMIDQ